MTTRRKISRLARGRIFTDNGGKCCLCGNPIDHVKQKWIVEHIKPLWLGGADDESNMKPAHQFCAVEKTAEEAAVKAKTDRLRLRHLGIKKPRTITRWRRFNQTPVYAERERS